MAILARFAVGRLGSSPVQEGSQFFQEKQSKAFLEHACQKINFIGTNNTF